MYLSECSHEIRPIIQFLFDTLNVEVAVIDRYGQLVATSQGYTLKKGTEVHTPFLEKVFSEGFVLVNDPGYSPQCEGCRFRADCPSSLELLTSIRLNSEPIGVLSMVAFTKSVRNRITHDVERYGSILDSASQWISNLVKLEIQAHTGGGALLTVSSSSVNLQNPPNPSDVLQKKLSINDLDVDSSFYSLIGSSRQIKELRKTILRVARFGSSVLIQGETGSGKGIVAKALHEASLRSRGPFITVNCASLPESLFESELFGYAEGAFTGARRGGKPGYFELADGGTIFLDEIGELPLHLQPKLLTVLEERRIQRIGGTHRIPVDVRIIAATNRDLTELLAKQAFRLDLFHRLSVIPLRVPALRDHPEDIPYIAQGAIRRLQRTNPETRKSLSPEALQILVEYDWPGNVRQLENVLEYAYCMEDGLLIQPNSLPDYLQLQDSEQAQTHNAQTELEQKMILSALSKYGYDVKGKRRAAEDLGMSVRTLYRKLERLGIESSGQAN